MIMGVPEPDPVRSLPPIAELGARMTGVETTVANMAGDVAELKATMTTFVGSVNDRFRMVEEVRVRAIEDQLKVDKAITHERERVAEENADRASEKEKRAFSRRDGFVSAGFVACVTIVAALIESGHIFH